MSDCIHVHRYGTGGAIPPLTQEQLEAGHITLLDKSYRWGPCGACVSERLDALENAVPSSGDGARLAIGGKAIVRIECDPHLAKALEIMAPVVGPLLSKWLGVKTKCQHGVEPGNFCSLFPCNGVVR